MNLKKFWLFIVFLLSVSLFSSLIPLVPMSKAEIPDYIIDGETVYIDTDKAYISATPHTVTRSQYVEINVTSKAFTGDMDIYFGFEREKIKPRSLELYFPHTVTQEEDLGQFKDGRHKFNTSDNIVYIYYNQTVYSTAPEGSTDPENLTDISVGWRWVLTYSHYFDEINVSEGWIRWHELKLWIDLASRLSFTKVYKQYSGMSVWFYAKDIPVTSNTEYKLRMFLDLIPTLNTEPSKYCIGIKPSHETLQESIDRGHLYLLDPWLSGEWDQRVPFTVDSGDIDENLTNFPFLLYISGSSGISSDDLTAVFDEVGANSLKIAVTQGEDTECYVEIEGWDDGGEEAWLWVRAPSISDSVDEQFYLYYDNDHADNAAYVGVVGSGPGELVWDANFQMVLHLSEAAGNFLDSTSNDNDASAQGNGVTRETELINGGVHLDGSSDFIRQETAGLGSGWDNVTVESWASFDALGGDRVIAEAWAGAPTEDYLFLYYRHADTQMQTRDAYSDNTNDVQLFGTIPPALTTWYHYAGTRIRNDFIYGYENGVETQGPASPDLALDTYTYKMYFGIYSDGTTKDFDGPLDEIRLSDSARSAAWLAATYEAGRDELLEFAASEHRPPTIMSASISDMDDTDNVYEMKDYYTFVVVVEDENGATYIDKVYLQGKQGAAVRFEVRATSLTGVPAYAIQTGATIIDLDTGSCTWAENGDEGTATFKIRFEWDYTDEADCELAVYAENSGGGAAGFTDMQTDYFDVIGRLVTYNFDANVTTVPVNTTIQLSGYVRYATTVGGDLGSSSYPPDAQFTSVQIQNDDSVTEATDAAIVNGLFNVTFLSHLLERTTLYYAYLDLLADYVDGLAPDGDYVPVTTTPAFYLSQLIEDAFSTFGVLNYLVNATAYGTALGAYFIDSISNIMQLITQQFLLVLGIFDFFIDWYTRMMSLVISISNIIQGLLDGTGTVTTGLGDIWAFISISTWIDIVPVFLFLWWVDSITTRGERQGEITVFLGDMQTVLNVTSWFLSMFGLVINTVTDLAFRLLGVIT